MLDELLKTYSDEGNERIGFILSDGEIVEVTNQHDDPQYGANMSSTDLHKYLYSGEYDVVATWHTHPSKSSNLTGDDYSSFKRHPQLEHYIVGKDGVRKFVVDNGVVRNG